MVFVSKGTYGGLLIIKRMDDDDVGVVEHLAVDENGGG